MKSILITFIIISFGCRSESQTQRKHTDFKNDWERLKLAGKVKEYEETSFRLYQEDDQKVIGEQIEKRKTYFNKSGNLEKYEVYNADDQLTSIRTFTYNEKQLNTQIRLQDHENKKEEIHSFEYDSAGRIIYQKEIKNGKSKIYLTQYDSLGNEIQKLQITPKDSVLVNYTYDYDSAGRKISRLQMDTAGIELNRVLTTYNYDKNGNLIEEIREGGFFGQGTTKYEYGQKGNLLTKTFIVKGTVRERFEYDQNMHATEEWTSNNGKFYKILYNTYKLDRRKNWIERETSGVSYDEHFRSPKELVSITKRKIVYY